MFTDWVIFSFFCILLGVYLIISAVAIGHFYVSVYNRQDLLGPIMMGLAWPVTIPFGIVMGVIPRREPRPRLKLTVRIRNMFR